MIIFRQRPPTIFEKLYHGEFLVRFTKFTDDSIPNTLEKRKMARIGAI